MRLAELDKFKECWESYFLQLVAYNMFCHDKKYSLIFPSVPSCFVVVQSEQPRAPSY